MKQKKQKIRVRCIQIYLTESEYRDHLEYRPILLGKPAIVGKPAKEVTFPSFEDFKEIKEKMKYKNDKQLEILALDLLNNSANHFKFHCVLISFPLEIITNAYNEYNNNNEKYEYNIFTS
ncbi:17097_t:CDS:2 [Entrophospora sp. SA101]|nr:17097_t:CDS:2 [Entrophospora sp. SA101]CAJ0845603.1 15785_t:CDS:2 [Entrophospora sp. SA101]CAJ0918507.1 12428_t:CDS:2 [Entrophospora sp. SA101]CAJ0924328.1 5186_t:CDS:2 [Entrophospora sp. SA101]